MWKTITKPFAWLMIWLYNLTGSYGWAHYKTLCMADDLAL